LQRLYSTFARGWPGAGLLCLRLVGAAAAFHYALDARHFWVGAVTEGTAGLLLCAGLWTPVAGVILTAAAVWSFFSVDGDPWPQLLLAAMAIALALLGPGAWSIDARLFGRKRLIREP
jgi:putative oxidoreductase